MQQTELWFNFPIIHWIGREHLQKSPVFHGKNHGFGLRFALRMFLKGIWPSSIELDQPWMGIADWWMLRICRNHSFNHHHPETQYKKKRQRNGRFGLEWNRSPATSTPFQLLARRSHYCFGPRAMASLSTFDCITSCDPDKLTCILTYYLTYNTCWHSCLIF